MGLGWTLFDTTVCFYEYGIVMLLLVRKLGFAIGRFRLVLLGYVAAAGADSFFYWSGLHHTPVFYVLLAGIFLYAIFVYRGAIARRIIWGCIGCGLGVVSINLTLVLFALGGVRDLSTFMFPSYTRFIVFVGNLLVLTFLYFLISNLGGKKGEVSKPFRITLISVFVLVLLASQQMANLYMIYGTGSTAEPGISESLVLLASVLIASFLSVLFFFEYTSLLAQEKKQAELELEQKKWEAAFLEQACFTYDALRLWKHDYQNHMDVLRSFLKNKKYRELEDYLSQLDAEMGPFMQVYYTGNSVADAVLSNKLFLAKTRGIQVNAMALLPGKLTVSDVQFGSVLSNLLDNAIEAQGNGPEPFINVSIRRERGMLQIKVENSANGLYSYKGGRLISSKKGEGRGIGLLTIRKIIESVGGIMDVQPEVDRFTVKILLPMKEESEVS